MSSAACHPQTHSRKNKTRARAVPKESVRRRRDSNIRDLQTKTHTKYDSTMSYVQQL